MPVEFSDLGLNVIGNNVRALRFFDDARVMQAEIYLDSQNRLNIGSVLVAGGGSGGGPSTDLSTVPFLTLVASPLLTDERVLAVGAGLTATDAGGGGAYTLAVDSSVVRTTRSVLAGNGLAGGGTLGADVTLSLAATVAGAGLTHAAGVLAVGAGAGLTVNADDVALTTPGGLSATSTNSAAGSHTHAIDTTIARAAVTLTAGAGLTGGGDLSANRSFAVGAGAGITVNADDVALTTPGTVSVSSTNTATGNHTHAVTSSANPGAAASLLATDASGFVTVTKVTAGTLVVSTAVGSSLIPSLTDTYDLGSSTKLWRKGYLSEMDTVVFAQNTITLLGGWLIVGKDEGAFAADVSSGATTIDFGKAMTVGHFVLCRGILAVEYFQVGTLVSGTTYNVTRNLDGSGANTWPMGTPFSVLGTTGDGRIELNAYDTPRISVITQGATYNAQTEVIRIGDLNGSFGVASQKFGIGLGDYANSNYMSYNSTDGFVVKAGAGAVSLDANGLSLIAGMSKNKITWYSGVYDVATIYGSSTYGGTGGECRVWAISPADTLVEVILDARDDGTKKIYLQCTTVQVQNDLTVINELNVGSTNVDSSSVEVGVNGSGNRYSYVDLHGDDTYTDYSFRILRDNTGANANSYIVHRGTGILYVQTIEAADIVFQTSNVTRGKITSLGSHVLANAALATNATDGFTYIPTCAGAPTGVPTAQTGTVPMIFDTTNNRLYVYRGGAWAFTAI